MEMVQIQFHRRAILAGGPLFLPGEIAAVPADIARQFCNTDPPTATLITSLDAPPLNKMVAQPVNKKELQWVTRRSSQTPQA